MDRSFDVYKESGFGKTIPLPRQNATQTLLDYVNSDEEIVQLFTILIRNEGTRFYNAHFRLWEKDKFIGILEKHKWIFDPDLVRFLRDPFYENEINLLNELRIIDLRHKIPIEDIIKKIKEASEKMSMKDLDWRITMRLYDLNPKIAELVRKIIDLLLVRQNLQKYAYEVFMCLKELAINASKANYKLLFDRLVTKPQGISSENNYFHFLRLFKEEIEEHGNENLIELAKKEDKFINLTFQSSKEYLEIWVTNSESVSTVEKEQILKRLGKLEQTEDNFGIDDEDVTEGAGLGITIITSILDKYSTEDDPLRVVFYPEFIKIGFHLLRADLLEHLDPPEE